MMDAIISIILIFMFICTFEPLYIVAAGLFSIAESAETVARKIKGK
jgi:hypothetical protein